MTDKKKGTMYENIIIFILTKLTFVIQYKKLCMWCRVHCNYAIFTILVQSEIMLFGNLKLSSNSDQE